MLYRYNFDKNAQLITQRGIGFEEIIDKINNGDLITTRRHCDTARYPNQWVMYVKYSKYVYVVPYVIENDGTIFMKTLYPSRKATKMFLCHVSSN